MREKKKKREMLVLDSMSRREEKRIGFSEWVVDGSGTVCFYLVGFALLWFALCLTKN